MSTGGNPAVATTRYAVIDREGNEIKVTNANDLTSINLAPENGPYQLLLYATNPTAPNSYQFEMKRSFGGPITLEDPSATGTPTTGKSPIPSLAVGLILGAFGTVAIAIALIRRK